VVHKYGEDHVAQIITFGTHRSAKAAIRDVGRVLEIPYAEADKDRQARSPTSST
jgi:DNA polymerase-3 subunit alpha